MTGIGKREGGREGETEGAVVLHLDDWIDVDEVQSLYLMRLQPMRALHAWQYADNLLCQCTGGGEPVMKCESHN